MRLIQAIVEGFILTAGITPPSPAQKRVATIFIATCLIGTMIALAALFLFAVTHFLHN